MNRKGDGDEQKRGRRTFSLLWGANVCCLLFLPVSFSFRKSFPSPFPSKIGEVAEAALREAFKSHPTLEARRRIAQLLESLKRFDAVPPPPKRLRALSGVNVLEHIGDKEARSVLHMLAGGAPQARQTRKAKAAFLRLSKRTLARP